MIQDAVIQAQHSKCAHSMGACRTQCAVSAEVALAFQCINRVNGVGAWPVSEEASGRGEPQAIVSPSMKAATREGDTSSNGAL